MKRENYFILMLADIHETPLFGKLKDFIFNIQYISGPLD